MNGPPEAVCNVRVQFPVAVLPTQLTEQAALTMPNDTSE